MWARSRIGVISSAVMFALVGSAHASTFTLTVTPNSIVGGSSIAGVTGSYAPGFEGGSFQATPTGGKDEIYFSPSVLFGYDVAIGDIASMSWWTNKDSGFVDWYLAVYTVREGDGQDSGSWYDSRLNAEPYFITGYGYTPGDWTQWSTASGLRFFDAPRTGNYGRNTDPFWSAFSGPVDWASYGYVGGPTHDYSAELVLAFSLQTGSDWYGGFTGLLDGLEITLRNGDVARVNFEPIPEPATLLLLGTGLGAVAVRRRRRAKSNA